MSKQMKHAYLIRPLTNSKPAYMFFQKQPPEMLYKKGVLKANTSARVPFTFPGSMERPATLFKKGSGVGVFL